jgi:hypothetical protein
VNELINRTAVIQSLAELALEYIDMVGMNKDDVHDALMEAYAKVVGNCIERVKSQPAVAKSIVRCGECENAMDIGQAYLICPMIDGCVKKDFYCAHGERKKDGN